MTSFLTAASEISTRTWNGAVSHGETGSARVDYFYKAVRGIEKTRYLGYLQNALSENSSDGLKISAYIRDCRGGKGERDMGRWSLQYIAKNHPKTFINNLEAFVNIGRFDDLYCLYELKNKEISSIVTNYLVATLRSDLEKLDNDEMNHNITLIAKWLPTERSANDKKYDIVKKICKKLECDKKTYRQNLSRLRTHLDIVEKNMCNNYWDKINYSKVPSRCMNIHGKTKKAFVVHDKYRFNDWKESLATSSDPKVKVNVKQLYPHEIVKDYIGDSSYGGSGSGLYNELTEQQWITYMKEKVTDEMREQLSKLLVVADVSGSMFGGSKTSVSPIQVCIGLALMISEVTPMPFRNHVLTFHTSPQFHHIIGSTLHSRVKSLERASWGGSTNISGTFNALLRKAIENKVPQEDMPERLLIISDMQFNCCDRSNTKTNLNNIKAQYKSAGYEMPQLIFWNVNGATSDFPSLANDTNTVLLSGFSIELLKSLMTGTNVTPLEIVLNMVSDERYEQFEWCG